MGYIAVMKYAHWRLCTLYQHPCTLPTPMHSTNTYRYVPSLTVAYVHYQHLCIPSTSMCTTNTQLWMLYVTFIYVHYQHRYVPSLTVAVAMLLSPLIATHEGI